MERVGNHEYPLNSTTIYVDIKIERIEKTEYPLNTTMNNFAIKNEMIGNY